MNTRQKLEYAQARVQLAAKMGDAISLGVWRAEVRKLWRIHNLRRKRR